MNEEGIEKTDGMEHEQPPRDEIHSMIVRAGKRTYFFDVKATRRNDYYLTITESKKRFGRDGNFTYEKHKLFLYKEDFDKFSNTLKEIIDYIKELIPEAETKPPATDVESDSSDQKAEEVVSNSDFTNVKFEDLEDSSN